MIRGAAALLVLAAAATAQAQAQDEAGPWTSPVRGFIPRGEAEVFAANLRCAFLLEWIAGRAAETNPAMSTAMSGAARHHARFAELNLRDAGVAEADIPGRLVAGIAMAGMRYRDTAKAGISFQFPDVDAMVADDATMCIEYMKAGLASAKERSDD